MKTGKILLSALLLISVALVSSCDFLRAVAGRPGSKEIEQKRVAIEAAALAKEEALKADTVEVVEIVKDTVDAAVVASVPPIVFVKLSEGKIRVTKELPAKYILIVGAFSVSSNAEKLVEQFLTKGYSATALPYANGFTAVGVAASDTRAELYSQLVKLKDEPLCPKDAWVLVNE